MIDVLSKPNIREDVKTKKHIRILYLEDNPGDIRLFTEMLKNKTNPEYSILHSPDLNNALEQIKQDDFDLILADLNLPDSEGLDTIKSLLNSDFQNPIIALTMDDNEVSGMDALKIGAHDFLVKGKIKPHDLTRAINYAIERKKLQDLAASKEKMFRATFEQSPIGMGQIDFDGNWILVNQGLCSILNFDKEFLLKIKLNDLIFQDDRNELSNIQTQLLKNKLEKYVFETRLIGKDNLPVWVNITSSVVKDEGNNPRYFFVVIENITMRKKIEQALWEREKQFRGIFEQAAVGMAHVSLNGKIVKANKRLLDIFRCKEFEKETISFNDFIHPDYIDVDAEERKNLLSGEMDTYSVEKRLNNENGSKNWVNITSSCLKSANGSPEYYIYIVEDITKKREIEEALKESEKNLSLVFNEIPSSIAISTIDDGIYKKVNRGFTDIFEYSSDEAVGRTASELGIFMNPTEKERWLKIILEESSIKNQEVMLRTKSGKKLTGLLSAITLKLEGKTHLLTVIDDITERKQASDQIKQYAEELEKNAHDLDALNKSLEESNATKDKLFSIISHDLRSPFEPLLGMSMLLKDNVEELSKDEIEEYSLRINSSLKKLYELVENLLQWSAVSSNRIEIIKEEFNITRLVEENLELHKLKAKQKNIDLIKNFTKDYEVFADANMINTVLRNLISNAVKFSDPGGTVTISAEEEGTSVRITVSDEGIGIKEEDLRHIFSVGKVLKEGTSHEKGTGLGLALSREFIILNQGQLKVESKFGVGSDFSFTLPVP